MYVDDKSRIKQLYALQEISNWDESGSDITVPSLQRGLVWKANQMELLWDSILRGFPIGSFVIAEFPELDNKPTVHLLDGQQRMNAIKLGFQTLSESDDLPVLWYDLEPTENLNSTRKHWIKVCSPAHPWGYSNNDDCTKLTANQKREACEQYSIGTTYPEYRPSPMNTWPIKANLPIPLYILILATYEATDETAFGKKVNELLELEEKSLPQKWCDGYKSKCKSVLDDEACRKALFTAFSSLKKYYVAMAFLPKVFLSAEARMDDQQFHQAEEVECLFDRMNTLGTRISSSDLHYSVIKSHFPEIKEENEKVANNIMPPAHLVMLAFRLALTPSCSSGDEGKKLHPPLSLQKIRQIAKGKNDDKYKEWSSIQAIYGFDVEGVQNESPLECIVHNKLNAHLKYGQLGAEDRHMGLPPALALKIAMHSPEVYLLLMWLVREDLVGNVVTQKLCLQLATVIHWFANKKTDVCNAIVKESISSGEISHRTIRKGLFCSIKNSWLKTIYPTTVLDKNAEKWSWSSNWNWWASWGNTQYWEWLIQIGKEKEILLYAQRHYLAEQFNDYDPANVGLFAEDNRPWDMDHIIPQNWISGKWGDQREFCKQWLNNIGNFAAIPFEINRSKSDNDDNWKEYRSNKEGLLFEEGFSMIGNQVTSEENAAQKFAGTARDRLRKIYDSWYTGLNIQDLLKFDAASAPSEIKARRELYIRVKELLEISGLSANRYFVQGNREFPIDNESDIHFCKDWLSVGIEVGGQCLVCLSTNSESYEIGIRKAPELNGIDKDYKPALMENLATKLKDEDFNYQNSGWWYVVKSTNIAPEADKVAKKISYIVDILQNGCDPC